MTAAQKKAKDNFRKAIAYRQATGVNLKDAFAHVYGRKVGEIKKKAAPKKKAASKKAPPKKKAAPKKKPSVKKVAPVKVAPTKTTVKKYNSVTTVSGVKKAAAKKVTESHKDTKSHNVNIRVVSGTKYFNNPKAKYDYNDPNYILGELLFWQNQLEKLRAEYKSPHRKEYKMSIKQDILLSKKWVDTYKKKLKDSLIKLK
jgi:hypothetical protein